MSESRQPVGILLIATNKYKQFVQPLIAALDKNFLPGHQLKIFLFSDGFWDKELTEFANCPRINIQHIEIPSYKFPQATLYRYKIFTSRGKDIYKDCSHLFYLDVDMGIVSPVGKEILAPITAVRHPGFYISDSGSWGNDPKSLAYTLARERKHYYAGGFQGGSLDHYWAIMTLLANRIDIDEQNGVMAEWHDETHWNWFLANNPVFNELTPEYCMVEQQELRKKWGIDHFQPKIVALAKDHKKLRE